MTTSEDFLNACADGNLETVEYLFESVHSHTKINEIIENNVAVQMASANGHLKVVKYLVEKGVNFRADNNRAIKLACQNGHLETAVYLEKMGGEFRLRDFITMASFYKREFALIVILVSFIGFIFLTIGWHLYNL